MKALFCHDHFYLKHDDDHDLVLSKGQFDRRLWQRYLTHFDALTVLGRDGGLVKKDTDQFNISSDKNIVFDLYPNTNSLTGLTKRGDIKKNIAVQVAKHDIVILRGISEIGTIAFFEAKKQNKPVALEMVACPWDSLWYYGSIKGKLYAPYRWMMGRYITKHSDGVIYVSQNFLQNRYPTDANITACASNVEIDEHNLSPYCASGNDVFTVGLIGALSNQLKGIETAIKAMGVIKKQGDDITLRLLGPGDLSTFNRLIQNLDIKDRIIHDGLLPSGAPVLKWLQGLDAYIQPSYQEGVPRAVIEAMSQSLPVIGSNAGGIPELLTTDDMMKKGDYKALATKLTDLKNDAIRQKQKGEKNCQKASRFTHQKLSPIRDQFWSNIAHYVTGISR